MPTAENEALNLNGDHLRNPAERIAVRTRNKLLALTFALCALSFALVDLLPGVFYSVLPAHDYVVIHIAFEFMSIVVSFAVFTIGWYGYKQTANRQDLVIGLTFLMVALVDFAHTLSYDGMPDFLSINSVSKAALFWVAARLIEAVGVIAAAFLTADDRRRWANPGLLAAGAVAVVTTLVVLISYFPGLLPAMYIMGKGLTPAKIALEWTVIALYAAAIYVFGRRGHRETNVVLLQMALTVGIFSELSFTLYTSAYDTYNLLGHVYKVIANYIIFRALFVSSFQRPYYHLVQAGDRLQQTFARMGNALATGRELKQVLQLVAELASEMLGARSAVVMMLHDGELRIEAQTGVLATDSTVSAEHSAAGMSMSSGNPVVIDDVHAIPGHGPDCHCQQLVGPPARSVVSAPIMSGTVALGVIQVYAPRVSAFGPREADLISAFARQAAAAIRNSIVYEREHQIAETLQRSLLPSVPSLPGLDIAVRYIPADDVARVGGDLYDVFSLEDGKLAVVIGDVSGHGLEAASMMAMTAYTLRGLLLHGMPPGEAFELTNRAFVRGCAELRFMTAFAAVVDPKARTMEYASAGHMMPMLLRQGICGAMEQRADLPLGIDASAEFHTRQADLSGVSGILLYTDGLIEARRHGDLWGEGRLTSSCGEMLHLPAAELIDRLIERATQHAGMLHDDVAILVVKWDEA